MKQTSLASLIITALFVFLPNSGRADVYPYPHHGVPGELGPSSLYPKIHYWFPRVWNVNAYIRRYCLGRSAPIVQYPPSPEILPAATLGPPVFEEVLPPPTELSPPEQLPFPEPGK